MARARKTPPLPAWLEYKPPESARAHMSEEGWVTEFERCRVHPFIENHRHALGRLWWKIVERTEHGDFKIGADGPDFKRSRPHLNPLERQGAAYLGLIEDAVFFVSREARAISRRPWGEVNFGGNRVNVPRKARQESDVNDDARKEHARAVCACLLISSKAYWGRFRPKVAWRLTLIATKVHHEVFTFKAAKALADMLSRADSGAA
jgi:hypothetical protein